MQRKHFYRETASSIVAQKKVIVLEQINLTDFAETRDNIQSCLIRLVRKRS